MTPLPFVQRRGRRRRGILAPLGAVSLIDLLVAIVVFLIAQPQALSSECCCIQRDVKVPFARHVEDMLEAPMVSVVPGGILVDGVPADSTRSPRVAAETGRVERIEELRSLLAAKRALWKQVVPHKPFPGVVILMIDREVPAVVVKSVFRSAVEAGYPNVSFMVRKLGGPPD